MFTIQARAQLNTTSHHGLQSNILCFDCPRPYSSKLLGAVLIRLCPNITLWSTDKSEPRKFIIQHMVRLFSVTTPRTTPPQWPAVRHSFPLVIVTWFDAAEDPMDVQVCCVAEPPAVLPQWRGWAGAQRIGWYPNSKHHPEISLLSSSSLNRWDIPSYSCGQLLWSKA